MHLQWYVNEEHGFLDIVPREYDEAYFEKYVGYEKTARGQAITQARVDFVDRFHSGALLDIGIGSGHFVSSRNETFGFDVNPAGVAWLKERGLFRDPMDAVFPAYSFWDSFEHIKTPQALLDHMPKGTKIFMSIPVFDDPGHVLRSKHFRPDEHYWYFTVAGLIKFMALRSFACLDIDRFEIDLGREDIRSFVFQKI